MDRFGVKAKVEEIKREEKELRKQVSRLASMANKRIQRLEQSELTDTPAYKSWEENGKCYRYRIHRYSRPASESK